MSISRAKAINFGEEIKKNGLIIRLIETEGKHTVVKLVLPFLKIKKAYLANLVEEDEELLHIKENNVSLSVDAFAIVTVRVLTDKASVL